MAMQNKEDSCNTNLAEQGNNGNEIFGEKEDKKKKSNNIDWKHGGYVFIQKVRRFFSNPNPPKKKKELDVLEQIQILIETNTTNENIEKCKELSKLHRITENTKARKRLEQWSLKVICTYLIVVLVIIILNYTVSFFNEGDAPIPSQIMITILSTTTVNIIGLGLIVLRGHFLSKEIFESSKGKDGDETK